MTPEVAVVGGGPAGCAAARLLAEWGHRVELISRPPRERRPLAESIPPSANRVLAAVGITAAVEHAHFHPWRGNTVWWGSDMPRIESFPAGVAGYQVERGEFDRLLRDEAVAAGAELRPAFVRGVFVEGLQPQDLGATGGEIAISIEEDGTQVVRQAAFVLDCSGRAGVIARAGLRRMDSGVRTIALAGVWTAERWPDTDDTHTLVASHAGGWAWSIAINPRVRYVTVMVDPSRSELAKGGVPRDVYLAELAKVAPFRSVLARAEFAEGPWGADASQYDAVRYSGPGFLLVGDAGSFIDPLSSSGVKKALASGWLAAVAAHTALTRPAMRDAALEFFDRRERDVLAAARRQAAQFAGDAAGGSPWPFWASRSAPHDDAHTWSEIDASILGRDPDVLAAFADLRQRVTIDLRPNPDVAIAPRPVVRGREIVLDDHLLLPDAAAGVRYLRGIDLLALQRLAPAHRDVGDLCAALAVSHPAAPLPDVLGALSYLLARRALVHARG